MSIEIPLMVVTIDYVEPTPEPHPYSLNLLRIVRNVKPACSDSIYQPTIISASFTKLRYRAMVGILKPGVLFVSEPMLLRYL